MTIKDRIINKFKNQRHATCFLYAELIEKTLSSQAYDYTQDHLLDVITSKISNKLLKYINELAPIGVDNKEHLKTFENTIHRVNNRLRINETKCTEPFNWSKYIAEYPVNKYELNSSEPGSRKIDIFVNGKYECSTNWSRTCELARLRFIAKRGEFLEITDTVIAQYSK